MKEDVLTTATHPMTVEEYLEFEERSEIRHEFVNNQLIPIPGTTLSYSKSCPKPRVLRILPINSSAI